MHWIWQILFFILLLITIACLDVIWRWFKYQNWSFQNEWIKRKLNPIWSKAGVVEITGGAETGKTLLIILLTKNLWGRKWNNVPNVIEGCQTLKLNTLRKIWMGEFEDGLVGSNNVLLIDESWIFFSANNLHKNNISKKNLSSLLYFLSETSKNKFKIFYTTKQGANLPSAFSLLSANKSIHLRTLGITRSCVWFDKEYFYLDVEITYPRDFNKPSSIKEPKVIKRESVKEGKDPQFLVKSYAPWFSKRKILSIPFSQDDLDLYDKSWNLDSTHERQKAISIMNKFAADFLIETCRYKQSRTQKLMRENEILMWWKRHPEPWRMKEMMMKGWMLAKKRGLWQSAEESLNKEEEESTRNFILGKINKEEYDDKIKRIFTNRLKLNIKVAQSMEDKGGEEESGDNPFKPVEIKEPSENPKEK